MYLDSFDIMFTFYSFISVSMFVHKIVVFIQVIDENVTLSRTKVIV